MTPPPLKFSLDPSPPKIFGRAHAWANNSFINIIFNGTYGQVSSNKIKADNGKVLHQKHFDDIIKIKKINLKVMYL
jgi:hypothetical protein